MSVQGAAASTPWVDRSARKPAATDPAQDETAKATTEASSTRTAAPPRPATTSLTQQDFERALRFGAGGTGGKSLDQLVDAPRINRHAWDPVADRKAVTGFDRLAASLRNAAAHRDAASAGVAGTTEPASAPAETTAPAVPTLAYRPQTANEFGQQYVLNAIAAYKRNSNLTPANSPSPAPAPPNQPAAATPAPAPTTPASTQPAATEPAPAPTQPTPAPSTPPDSSGSSSSGSTTSPPASSTPSGSSGGLLGTLFGGR